MIVYLDKEFRCHLSDDSTMTAVETDVFSGKCAAYIEGHRFVPQGESWTRSDGVVFTGEMIAACKPYSELDAIQREYEREQIAATQEEYEKAQLELADMRAALELLGVTIDG